MLVDELECIYMGYTALTEPIVKSDVVETCRDDKPESKGKISSKRLDEWEKKTQVCVNVALFPLFELSINVPEATKM